MAITSAFQADDVGSIPIGRSFFENLQVNSCRFFYGINRVPAGDFTPAPKKRAWAHIAFFDFAPPLDYNISGGPP